MLEFKSAPESNIEAEKSAYVSNPSSNSPVSSFVFVFPLVFSGCGEGEGVALCGRFREPADCAVDGWLAEDEGRGVAREGEGEDEEEDDDEGCVDVLFFLSCRNARWCSLSDGMYFDVGSCPTGAVASRIASPDVSRSIIF